MGAHEALEHSEHIQHAGGHGHGPADDKSKRLGMFVGITMAVLGVLLAFCAARVGAERTELVQTLVAQQNAHAKYQGQDVKHRMAVLVLQGAHSQIVAGANLDKKDIVDIAKTTERYLAESTAAKEWVETYDPKIEAHIEGQEQYELGQLFAEIGIVVASVALLLRARLAWFGALALGGTALVITFMTWRHVSHAVEASEGKIEETGKHYRDLRNADKTTDEEKILVSNIYGWAGVAAPAPAAAEHHD